VTLYYLVRHGRTPWNETGRMQGWADPPLDALGRQQALALAAGLKGERFAAIYASPLRRAAETAQALAEAAGLAVTFDARLRERNLGEWQGLTFEEARRRDPERAKGDWRVLGPPGGEGQAALAARVAALLDEIAVAHPEQTVAVVSHGGALGAWLGHVLGIAPERSVSFSFPNAGLARVSVRAGHVRVLSLGDDRHAR
jgi:broad specificity phosphatase PhoE